MRIICFRKASGVGHLNSKTTFLGKVWVCFLALKKLEFPKFGLFKIVKLPSHLPLLLQSRKSERHLLTFPTHNEMMEQYFKTFFHMLRNSTVPGVTKINLLYEPYFVMR